MSERTVTAALIIIGNEILSGRTQDANLAFLAQELNDAGIQMREVRIVPDAEADIVEAVNACRARHDHVFTTGGIGPTHDDITSASVAKAFGVEFGFHPEAERRLRAYYPPEKLNDARLKMAQTPEGAELIDNPVSVAPGFHHRQRPCPAGRALDPAGDVRRAEAAAPGRCGGPLAHDHRRLPGRRHRQAAGARSSPAGPRSRSAATPSCARAASAPAWSCAASTRPPSPRRPRPFWPRRGPAASRFWTCSERRDWATPPRRHGARLAESVDARDLKSRARKGVPVRVRQRAP